MSEEVLFEVEKPMSNGEIAENLRNVADKIESGEPINLESESNSVVLETDRSAVFEIKVEREHDEESLELEIEWEKGKSEDLEIK